VPTNGKNSGAKWQKAQGPKGQAGKKAGVASLQPMLRGYCQL